MEGALWKWTNYWNGWQMRWFVLDNGVLAYYKSQEDVDSGCKGSMKVSTCEIVVHPHDNTRLTISIPGEQHMYLKTPTSQERQQWLVALGSAKACVTMTGRIEHDVSDLRAKRAQLRLYSDLLTQQVHQVKESSSMQPPDVDKMSEACGILTLTCDTFIKTLEECMKIAETNVSSDQHVTDVGLNPGRTKLPVVAPMKRSASYDSEGKT